MASALSLLNNFAAIYVFQILYILRTEKKKCWIKRLRCVHVHKDNFKPSLARGTHLKYCRIMVQQDVMHGLYSYHIGTCPT